MHVVTKAKPNSVCWLEPPTRKAGFLFRSTKQIIANNPSMPAYDTFDDLLAAFKGALA